MLCFRQCKFTYMLIKPKFALAANALLRVSANKNVFSQFLKLAVSDIMAEIYLQGRDLRMIKNDRRFDKATPSHPVIKQC